LKANSISLQINLTEEIIMPKKTNVVETPDENAAEQTELNPNVDEAGNPADPAVLGEQNPEAPPDESAPSGTDPELEEFIAQKEEADENPENDSQSDNNEPVKKTRRIGTKKTDPPPQSDGEPEKTPKRRARAGAIVSIDEARSVETSADKHNNDLLDLVESLKSKKILSGTIQGVERSAENANISYAVIYHGDFKVIIPAEEVVEPPEDFRDRSPGDVMHYMITKRLGAEIDFIVKGVDKSGIAAASRLEAMAAKRKEYYFGFDRDGNNLLYEGITAEARVVSAIRAGIFVDIFGLETYIPLRELSYQRGVDAAAQFQPGQRVLVKIISIDRTNRNKVKVSASVKQATENPYEKALRKYVAGSRYVGTVSMVDTNGVFVSLDGGIDCLCSYPKRGRPPRGSRVTVRIIGINPESNRIWGAITHMTTAR
jgi:predicted RNA-binding protein with RPS1 domain